jgi:hypothetical protein
MIFSICHGDKLSRVYQPHCSRRDLRTSLNNPIYAKSTRLTPSARTDDLLKSRGDNQEARLGWISRHLLLLLV